MTRTRLAPALQNVRPAIQTLGLCRTPESERALIASGIPTEQVWMLGRGHENLDEAIYYCRGMPAIFSVAEDLRILGGSQASIFAATKKLNSAGIRLQDIAHPDDDQNDMQHRAFKALHSATSIRSHKIAKRRGSRGGLAKAANEAARRNALIDDAIARRLCATKKLTWDEKSEITGICKSSLQRHYS